MGNSRRGSSHRISWHENSIRVTRSAAAVEAERDRSSTYEENLHSLPGCIEFRCKLSEQPSYVIGGTAGPGSYPAQSVGGYEDTPSAERRRRLLECGWVHPAQRRHEPPLAGVPSRLASPRRELPVVTPSKVLCQCGERSVYLGGARRGRLPAEAPRCDRGAGASKIM